jgi:diaminohydroxyphosphoribosylaminopyrimidine deaminase / 5-amino-6-(5-phosphoribosylamino)uracil reductase
MTIRSAPGPARDPFEAIDAAPEDRPFVVAQLGQSLDGRIATATGASRGINGTCALDHLHRLRAHVDAVIVGVGTVIADNPMLTVRRVPGRNPTRVFIDPHGRLPDAAQCVRSPCAPRIAIRATASAIWPGVEEVVIEARDGMIPPAEIMWRLHERGLRKLLVEGGARTISMFIAAGCVDRLHMLVAPIIIGSGVTGLSLPPINGLDGALRPVTHVHHFADGDTLFDCNLRSTGQTNR